MFRLKHVNRAVLALCAGGVAMGAVAQQQQPQTLQRVEITGSNIKRINAETVAPVEIITREQIERTGQPTIADVLRNIPGNTGSFGESFSNSFAPGAAGISLRGLGQKTTLVLVNGRRMAGYGFAQNLQDSFVDLNSIPSSAVERVEILKDGASAIYGSDAIAGVVNIILRRDFKGLELSVRGGAFEGKNDYAANISGGFGDLGSDKFNVFGVLDFYKRDFLSQKDVEFTKSRDFRDLPGGRNFESLTGGGTWRQLTPAGGLTNNYRAISGCSGTILTGPQAVERGLIAPTPANAALAAASNTFCVRDFADQFTALPGTERIGFLGRATYEVSPTMTAYAEAGLSRTDTIQTFQAPFFAGTTGLVQTAAGLRPFPYNINFAPGVSGNPFSTNARYNGVLNDMGTRDNEITSDAVRLLAGLKYTLGNWDLDSGVTFSKNEVTALNTNRLSLSGTSALFGVPSTPQPPLPTSTSTAYSLDNPASNSAAARDSFRLNFPRNSKSELFAFDTKASTELTGLRLPGGAVGLALGFEYREEKLNDRPAAVAQSGQVLGQGITATNGKRDSTALFAELALPITKQIEGQLALRHDRYSDYGNSTTPKVGVKFTPNDMIAVRANWGKGFRAPTLPEISPSVATFFTAVIDPEDDAVRNISGVFAGNPNLKAEKSTSATVGIVFEPNKNFNVSLDLYRIDWRDVVASEGFQTIVNRSCPSGPPCPSTANVIRDPNNNNQVVTILSNYQNLASRVTTGADVDARYTLSTTTAGKFTGRVNLTYVRSFKEDGVEYAGSNAGSNTIPRVRSNIALDWDKGPWSLTGRVNYTHKVKQDLLPGSYFTRQDPRFQNGVYGTDVSSLTTLDLFGRYKLNKNITLSASVINLLDKSPPYDPGFSGTSLYDFSLYSPLGRQIRVAFNYKM